MIDMRTKGKSIICYVFLGFLMLYVLGSGVWDLINTNARHTVVITEAEPLMQIENSINGLIPLGTDYYYLGIEENTSNVYVILASKNWDNKAFSSGQPVKVTGLAKKYDYKIQREVESGLGMVMGATFPLGVEQYLCLSYVRDACMKIVGIVALIVIVGIYLYYKKKELEIKTWQSKALLILFMVDLVVILLAIV